MKVLNLYAGIGGNRKLWTDVEVTAVENNPETAAIYQDNFQDDEVVVCDAHKFILENYKDFDFIWSSRPCITHSKTNHFLHPKGIVRYPDFGLYEEIVFLKQWFKGRWVCENVIPYYKPLIAGQECGRHLFWANFKIPKINIPPTIGRMNGPQQLRPRMERFEEFGIKLPEGMSKSKREDMFSNCIHPKLGLHILNCAQKEQQSTIKQWA